MAITISGENNNDKILASDGVIDEISGINIVGLLTAGHLKVGSNIQLGNAGIVTATTFVGNLTGNVNSTSPLLLQTGGSERFRITGNNELGIAGANYGSSGQVLTSGGSGSAVTWTTITGTTINTNGDNRIITGSGTANTLNGEANFIAHAPSSGVGYVELKHGGSSGDYGYYQIRSGSTLRGRLGSNYNVDAISLDTAGGSSTAMIFKTGSSQTERLRIQSDGKMGLGVSPSRHLDIKDSTGGNRIVNIRGTGTSGAFLAFLDANTTDDSKCRVGSIGGNSIGLRGDAHHFQNGAGTDRMVIDSSGRLLIGTTASRTTNSHVPALQVSGTSYHKSTVQIINNANDSTGAYLFLGKQRSGSAGGNTIVQNNDIVGQIRFSIADGTDMENQCAQIQATVDGVPGSNDTPGRLSFYTTPDNSTTLTERLRIASTGQSLFRVSGSQTTPINDGNVPVQIAETTGSMCYFGANKGSSYGSLFGHHTAFGGTVIRNILSDDIAFYTNNTSRKMTIRNNGNVEIENGDLKVASGHGIDFSSTGDASGMSSELLDDYEEGTWTPTASGFTISTTYSARYTKIGRLVHINCYLQAATGTGTSQQPHVGGLPFTSVGGNTYSYGAGRIGTGSYNNSQVDIVFQQQSSSTNVKLYVGGGGINEAMMSGGHVIFSMVYEAA